MKKEDIKKGYEQTPMYEDKYSEADEIDWNETDDSDIARNHRRRRRKERCDDNTR